MTLQNIETENNLDTEIKKEFLLNANNYEKLQQAQRKIENETQLRPNFKMIINMMFDDAALEKVTNELITKFK